MCCCCISGVTHYKKMTLTSGTMEDHCMEMGSRLRPGQPDSRDTARKGMLVVRASQSGSVVDSEPLFLPLESCLLHPGPVAEWRPKSPCLLCWVYGPLLSAPNGQEAGSGLANEVQQEVTQHQSIVLIINTVLSRTDKGCPCLCPLFICPVQTDSTTSERGTPIS